MQFNYGILIEKISEYGWKNFFDKVNMDVDDLLNVLYFGEEFDLRDVEKISDILCVDHPKDIKSFFFTERVEKTQR